MSQIRTKILHLFILFFVFSTIVSGCSDTHSGSGFSTDSGEHISGWVQKHGSKFRSDPDNCIECHGATLRGGISGVSCFSESFGGISCHPAGPPGHPLPFTDPADHGPPAKADLIFCQLCHAEPSSSGAGSNPKFNVVLGRLTEGCYTPGCHNQDTAHPVPWVTGPNQGSATNHQTSGNLAAACSLCHEIEGVNRPCPGCVGTLCAACHTAGSPITNTNCTSCHGDPPRATVCNEATDTCD